MSLSLGTRVGQLGRWGRVCRERQRDEDHRCERTHRQRLRRAHAVQPAPAMAAQRGLSQPVLNTLPLGTRLPTRLDRSAVLVVVGVVQILRLADFVVRCVVIRPVCRRFERPQLRCSLAHRATVTPNMHLSAGVVGFVHRLARLGVATDDRADPPRDESKRRHQHPGSHQQYEHGRRSRVRLEGNGVRVVHVHHVGSRRPLRYANVPP
mmetsp:Transcript_17648/g.46574  ORF Transcript_17648/g.46574 Transcript_17648/m.46574 type:complete len:208 (+) Transcript_17648:191-814(+)